MGDGVSEVLIYFYVNRAVGALSISQFSEVWIKSWLSSFSEGTVYCSVGCIIFNKIFQPHFALKVLGEGKGSKSHQWTNLCSGLREGGFSSRHTML